MAKDTHSRIRLDQLHRAIYLREQTPARGGKVNPAYVEWLLGFPISWTELPPSEIQSSRKSLK